VIGERLQTMLGKREEALVEVEADDPRLGHGLQYGSHYAAGATAQVDHQAGSPLRNANQPREQLKPLPSPDEVALLHQVPATHPFASVQTRRDLDRGLH
jgi:hypothetical protein